MLRNNSNPLNNTIKNRVINELNQDLYSSVRLSLYEANHYFEYYNDYICKLID